MLLLIFAMFWFACLGATIGSFLNVVIYRLPLGMSLSFPGSHCPHCKHPIRWFDNVPVFGWLALKGRCRDCAAPIGVRYPLVEATCGFVFAAMALCTFSDASWNTLERAGGLGAYLSIVFTTFLAAGMIERDRQTVPLKLFVPLIFIVFAFSLPFPFLHPVAYDRIGPWSVLSFRAESSRFHEHWGGGIDAAVGGVCGAVLAVCAFPFLKKERRSGWFGVLSCAGLCLGWQCTGIATVAAWFVLFATKPMNVRAMPILYFTVVAFGLVVLHFTAGYD